ncbi:MAG: PilZ domain-containing protein [Ahrensia sp.]|nr:PilZ domain-containing protein [Ahrensia sp.]
MTVALFGRCLLPGGLELPCQITQISPYNLKMFSASQPDRGEHIIVYVDHVGRLEGHARDIAGNGFAMDIDATMRKRERLASRIDWLRAHEHFGVEDARAHQRIEPKNKNSVMSLEDKRNYPVEIIDISISGAALSTPVKPKIGAVVDLAGMKGKVVRHFAEGIAIEFHSQRKRHSLFKDGSQSTASAA